MAFYGKNFLSNSSFSTNKFIEKLFSYQNRKSTRTSALDINCCWVIYRIIWTFSNSQAYTWHKLWSWQVREICLQKKSIKKIENWNLVSSLNTFFRLLPINFISYSFLPICTILWHKKEEEVVKIFTAAYFHAFSQQ